MKTEKEPDNYLPSQEQLIVSAKVNRLCLATPETFNSQSHVADAQCIVNALDPRIKPSGKFKGTISYTSSSTSEVHASATDAGNVNTSFKEEETKKIEFGVEEYRIGNYVAQKYIGKQTTKITFEHFWNRGINAMLDIVQEITGIEYDTKTLELINISIGIPQIRQIACLTIIRYQAMTLWQKDK